ncbi:hypothetical protein O5699_00545 [Escherichia coli]|nr:hypothetical protein [Escherichia coli]
MDEAMASLRLLPSHLRDPLIRHLSFLRKKQEADRRKGKKSQQAERYARWNPAQNIRTSGSH